MNWQMGGVLLGGILWGVLGDKRGRLSVLFASIALYSVANVANGFVHDVTMYAALRFVAGVGLAGELGAGITVVTETIPARLRSAATAIVASVGILGAVVGVFVAESQSWRHAYFVGGGLGVLLLLLRIGAFESGLFAKAKSAGVSRGNFFALFSSWSRFKRYACVILVAVPIWYVVGVLITFSPELGKAMGMQEAPNAGRAILFTYAALVAGDMSSGLLSHALKSRKLVLAIYLAITAVGIVVYFVSAPLSVDGFYAVCILLGVGTGYWAVFVTTAAEQFGTNLRATVTTTSPNFVRGMVVPITIAFRALKPHTGVPQAAIIVGVVVFVVAIAAWALLEESFGKDLDYLE